MFASPSCNHCILKRYITVVHSSKVRPKDQIFGKRQSIFSAAESDRWSYTDSWKKMTFIAT
jgi:hypothetical protein